MTTLFINNIYNQKDVIPLYAGEMAYKTDHSFGPYVRDHYIIHFLISGAGTLVDENGAHQAETGDLFIIRPGEVTRYYSEPNNPWHYVWLAFTGEAVKRFSEGDTVRKCPADIISRLKSYIDERAESIDAYTSLIHELLYKLYADRKKETEDKTELIGTYIKYRYMENITVHSLSKKFGFERSYLFKRFKKRFGVGIKEYIVNIRMENARRLLISGHSVGITAQLVGYHDEFNFSKAYKKFFGYPPSKTAKEILETK